ncbi:MAG: hypothetical protein H6727_04070 [Myxococcales bacterium]|nr:hypothetical protein [Myxococcales bacterium]
MWRWQPRKLWIIGCLCLLSWWSVGCPPVSSPTDGGEIVPDQKDASLRFRVMTMNVGTTVGLDHDKGEGTSAGDGYTSEHAKIADMYYGNGLSWPPAEKALTAFLAREKPDVVGFQEMFFDPECEGIPESARKGFVCEDYQAGRTQQMERLLGADYQVACAVGQPDNCVGIRRSFGRFVDCPQDKPCLDGVVGQGPADGCSRGARIGRIHVETVSGRSFVLVLVHGTSGFKEKDQLCRREQFKQIFEDQGDGKPAARGEMNLVMGDINTDPFILKDDEPSSAYWNEKVGEGKGFYYLSSSGETGPPTYSGPFRIDHVISDTLTGTCKVFGSSEGTEPVISSIYWDHKPIVCDVVWK